MFLMNYMNKFQRGRDNENVLNEMYLKKKNCQVVLFGDIIQVRYNLSTLLKELHINSIFCVLCSCTMLNPESTCKCCLENWRNKKEKISVLLWMLTVAFFHGFRYVPGLRLTKKEIAS